MKKTTPFEDFLEALGFRESSGRYDNDKNPDYHGKYQMGKLALAEAGYYNLKTKSFTGKNGIKSKQDFLKSPGAQEDAIRTYQKSQWKQIQSCGGEKYIGQKINGIEITPSGLLAGAHLVGPKNACQYLKNKGKSIPKDGNGTSIEEYLKKFSQYDISEVTGNKTSSVSNKESKDFHTPKNSHSTGSSALREKTGNDIISELLKSKDEKIRRYEEQIYQSMLKKQNKPEEQAPKITGQTLKDMLEAQKQKLSDFKDKIYMESAIERKFNGKIPEDYQNPELESDKIFTQEDLDAMNASQKSKNAAAIRYQKKTMGIPTKAQAAKAASKKGSGLVHVNGYIRNGKEIGDYYRALPKK